MEERLTRRMGLHAESAVTGVRDRTNEFYFGSVNDGVWKTSDGGRVWKPVFDQQPVASIGAMAVAPSSPEFHRVYVFPSIALDGPNPGPVVEYDDADGTASRARFCGGSTESRSMNSTATNE